MSEFLLDVVVGDAAVARMDAMMEDPRETWVYFAVLRVPRHPATGGGFEVCQYWNGWTSATAGATGNDVAHMIRAAIGFNRAHVMVFKAEPTEMWDLPPAGVDAVEHPIGGNPTAHVQFMETGG